MSTEGTSYFRNFLKILILTAITMWSIWREPNYTLVNTIWVASGAVLAFLGMLFVRRVNRGVSYLMLLPLGALMVSTALFAAHL